MNYVSRISAQRPRNIEWNKTCDVIYVRKNIVFHEDEFENYYTFDEYKYNARNFTELYFEQLRADLDYLSMMAEVDL